MSYCPNKFLDERSKITKLSADSWSLESIFYELEVNLELFSLYSEYFNTIRGATKTYYAEGYDRMCVRKS